MATALERAFELAKSGRCAGIADVRKQLKSEGYSDAQIVGRTLVRQLIELCTSANKASA